MADRKQNPWLALVENVLFRVAFAGFILLEFVVFVLFLWGISKILPGDNDFVLGVLIGSVLISPFAIGAASYLVFQRLTRAQYVLAESERWRAERREADVSRIRRRRRLKRWTPWIPTVAVALACVFLDGTFALTSHLFRPGSFKLIGYRVSIPLNWMVGPNMPVENGAQSWSVATANRTNGMLRAGLDFYLRRKARFSVSEMAFYGAAGSEIQTNRDSPFGADRLISSHTDLFSGGEITCSEYAPSQTDHDYREVGCSSSRGDFFCFVSGNDEDVAQFYRVLRDVQAGD
jgi:hypothetical protein